MVWDGYSLMRRLFGVQNNVTSLLVDNAISPIRGFGNNGTKCGAPHFVQLLLRPQERKSLRNRGRQRMVQTQRQNR